MGVYRERQFGHGMVYTDGVETKDWKIRHASGLRDRDPRLMLSNLI